MTVFQWIFSALTLWIGVSLFLTLGLIIAQLNDIQKQVVLPIYLILH